MEDREGFIPMDGNAFDIEVKRRQEDALERIATALELLASSQVDRWEDLFEASRQASSYFKEARDNG